MGSDLLVDQLMLNQQVLTANTGGLTQEDSLAAAPGGGNCLNWVLGHVVATRNSMLKLVDREPIWSDQQAAPYQRGTDPITAEKALPLSDILAAYAASQETLVEAVRGLSEDEMAASSPMSFSRGDKETVISALAAFLFHESYHIGQTGVLRRVAGKEGAIK